MNKSIHITETAGSCVPPSLESINSHMIDESLSCSLLEDCAKVVGNTMKSAESAPSSAKAAKRKSCLAAVIQHITSVNNRNRKCKTVDKSRRICHKMLVRCNVQASSENEAAARKNSYRCAECNKTFTAMSSLANHMRRHTGIMPFVCEQCDKRFAYSSSLRKHSVVHSSLTPYSCSVCGRPFKDSSNLRQHLRIHAGEKRHECADCGRRFTHLSGLQAHERVHRGQKPHSCIDCGKSFYDAGALRGHLRVHTGEKPHGCSMCPKRFTNTSNLTRHERSHRGEKPFGCNTCGKRFTNRDSVKYHERLHSCAASSFRSSSHDDSIELGQDSSETNAARHATGVSIKVEMQLVETDSLLPIKNEILTSDLPFSSASESETMSCSNTNLSLAVEMDPCPVDLSLSKM